MILARLAAVAFVANGIALAAVVAESWVRESEIVAIANDGAETVPISVVWHDGEVSAGIDARRAEVAIKPVAGTKQVILRGLNLQVATDDSTRALGFSDPTSTCRIGPFLGEAESETLWMAASADAELACLIHADFPMAERQIWRVRRNEDGVLEARLELRAGGDGFPVTLEGRVTFARGGDALATWNRLGERAPDVARLDSVSHLAAPPALALTTAPAAGGWSRICAVPVDARPLDVFRGEGIPRVWATPLDATNPALTVINAGDEALVTSVSLAEWSSSLARGASVVDATFSEELGVVRHGVLLPIPPNSTRRFTARSLDAADAPRPEVVCVRSGREGGDAEVLAMTADDPALSNEALATWSRSGIVVVHLPGAGSLEPLPPAIAQHLTPRIAPHRAISKSIAPKGALERFTKLASNLEWSLGFPQQPADARDWLVCLEAGFLATPLQPRIVDGMPAARGFMVSLVPGALIATSGFSTEERSVLLDRLRDGALRVDVLRRAVAAQVAVRAERPVAGLFAALADLPRTRSEDLSPGDAISLSRAAAFEPPGARRRLRTLRAPEIGDLGAGEPLTEDVLEYAGPFNFAIDLPRPFVDPLLVVVRRIDDGADFVMTYEGRPLDRIRTTTVPGTWCEEIHLLRPEWCPGQSRVQLSCGAPAGLAQLARLGFHSSSRGVGRGLGYLAPSGVIPSVDSVRAGVGADGKWIAHGTRVVPNSLELGAGSKIEFALPESDDPRLFTANVIAIGGKAPLEFVIETDGAERARYFVDPAAKEPLALRLEIASPERISLAASANAAGGSIVVLDPRLR